MCAAYCPLKVTASVRGFTECGPGTEVGKLRFDRGGGGETAARAARTSV